MARNTPKVHDGSLQVPAGEGSCTESIPLGTREWYVWLEQARSFRFESPLATFTARQEQRPGGWYWYAYRRRYGKLHIAYLGKSIELTVERLNAVAAVLAGNCTNAEEQHSQHELKDRALQADLEEKHFAHLWAQGRTMTPEQALASHGSAILAKQTQGTPEPDDLPSSLVLTRRERDVLRFLTMGLTSTQIAAQLVISLSTVNTHVRSIYNKLGVTSRSAATRYAVEHHLV